MSCGSVVPGRFGMLTRNETCPASVFETTIVVMSGAFGVSPVESVNVWCSPSPQPGSRRPTVGRRHHRRGRQHHEPDTRKHPQPALRVLTRRRAAQMRRERFSTHGPARRLRHPAQDPEHAARLRGAPRRRSPSDRDRQLLEQHADARAEEQAEERARERRDAGRAPPDEQAEDPDRADDRRHERRRSRRQPPRSPFHVHERGAVAREALALARADDLVQADAVHRVVLDARSTRAHVVPSVGVVVDGQPQAGELELDLERVIGRVAVMVTRTRSSSSTSIALAARPGLERRDALAGDGRLARPLDLRRRGGREPEGGEYGERCDQHRASRSDLSSRASLLPPSAVPNRRGARRVYIDDVTGKLLAAVVALVLLVAAACARGRRERRGRPRRRLGARRAGRGDPLRARREVRVLDPPRRPEEAARLLPGRRRLLRRDDVPARAASGSTTGSTRTTIPPSRPAASSTSRAPRTRSRDYSMVYVPSCTGDVHTGSRVTKYGPYRVHQKGFLNARAALERAF